jgi:hypothetical protein
MGRTYFLALFLFISFSLSSWEIIEEVFIPPVYFVGDSVLYQFRIVLEEGEEIVAPSELPETEWMIVESLDYVQNLSEVQISLRFKSFQTGTRTLPTIDLGAGKLDNLKIFTSSLSEQNDITEIYGIRDNLDFPGIKVIIAFFLIILFSSPYFIALGVRFFYGYLHRLIKWIMKSGPRIKIRRVEKKLLSRVDTSGNERAFFTELSRGIRSYLTERVEKDYSSMTTRDMERNTIPRVSNYLWNNLILLLKMADLVKFAGEKISRKDKVWSMGVLAELIETIEKETNSADL